MARSRWVRPKGCECSTTEAERDRCDEKWMRCNPRIRFVREQKLAELGGVPKSATQKSEEP